MFDRQKMMMISIVLSALMIFFGILLCIDYHTIMKKGSILIGALFMGGAIYFFVKYMTNRNMINSFDVSLLFMTFCLGLGILFMCMPHLTESLFKVIIGLLIVALTLFKMESLFVVEEGYSKIKIVLLGIGLLCAFLGIGVIFNFKDIFKETFFGIVLILFGLFDIGQSLYLRKVIKENS